MNYKTVVQARKVANVFAVTSLLMPRSQRLERWADLLLQHGDAPVRLLRGTEYEIRHEVMREDNSPLSVAFSDPILRLHGLEGDTYDDAYRFFGVRDGTLHDLVCHCLYGAGTVSAT